MTSSNVLSPNLCVSSRTLISKGRGMILSLSDSFPVELQDGMQRTETEIRNKEILHFIIFQL